MKNSHQTHLLIYQNHLQIFGLVQYMVHRRQFLVGIVGLAVLLSIPVIAYKTLPTFQGKVDYFSYDMFMYERGEGANLSDSGRLASLDAGWEITKDNWLWGVGTANIRSEVDQFFQEKYPDYPEVFMPQNQFLFSWAATGILGFLLTVFAFFYPVFYFGEWGGGGGGVAHVVAHGGYNTYLAAKQAAKCISVSGCVFDKYIYISTRSLS